MPVPRDVATPPAAPRSPEVPKEGGAAARGLGQLGGPGRAPAAPAKAEPPPGAPSRRTIALVQESWAALMPISDAASSLFYARLFSLDPTLRSMFKSDMTEQKKKLMQTLSVTVDGLGNLPKLVPVLQALGERHAGYMVADEHYDLVGDALLWTLREGLGDAYNDEIEAAWTEVYGLVSGTMKKAAAAVGGPKAAARPAAAKAPPPQAAKATAAAPAAKAPEAQPGSPIGRRTIALVQESWAAVLPISDAAATLFYDRLFTLDPSLRSMFKPDISEQKKKLMQMLSVAVDGLNNLPRLVPVLQTLGERHAGYMVADEHYDTVGEALLWTLREGLGDAYTDEVETAWIEVYGLVAGTMKKAAAAIGGPKARPAQTAVARADKKDDQTLNDAPPGRDLTAAPDPTATLREASPTDRPLRRQAHRAGKTDLSRAATLRGSESDLTRAVAAKESGQEPPGGASTAAGPREAGPQPPAAVVYPFAGQDVTFHVNVKLDAGSLARALEARAPERPAPGGVVPALLLALLCVLASGGAAAAVGLAAGAQAALLVGVPLAAALLTVAAFTLGYLSGRGRADGKGSRG